MRKRLGFIVVPLAIVPLALSAHPAALGSIPVIGGAICICSPIVGFWLGEIVGKSNEGRAALGCLGTLAVFFFYIVWATFAAPRLF